MTAVRMWAGADLRSRWRSWVLLGLLAGVVFGVVAAGVAGARRTADAVPDTVKVAHLPDAAVLANDPTFGAAQRDAVAKLPEVRAIHPFMVAIGLVLTEPKGYGDATSRLLPLTPDSVNALAGPVIEGRAPNPSRADEVVVDENSRKQFHLGLGSTIVVGQSSQSLGDVPPVFHVQPPVDFSQRMKVVGIAKSVSSDMSWVPSSGLYAKYAAHLPGLVNLMVDLRRGERDVASLQSDVARIAGHPVNVEPASEIFGLRKAENMTDVERAGLLLFSLVALIGGGVLVGQALVRAVSAGAADLDTWRAMGADRSIAARAMVTPTILTAAVGAVVTVVVAISLSPRFPIGVARRWELDRGVHADWVVIVVAVAALVVGTTGLAAASAWWAVSRRARGSARPSMLVRWTSRVDSPVLFIGSRLAVDPGRGRRAVPVRSAMLGAIVGVLGVVACFTFRNGLEATTASPERSGVVWNTIVASGEGPVSGDAVKAIEGDTAVGAVLEAGWRRAVPVNGTPVPMFGTKPIKGDVPFVMVAGRAPSSPDEVAFAPTTMKSLGLSVGDRVRVDHARSVRVVGEAFVPATSHTDYDTSGWMTAAGLERANGQDPELEDYVLIRWKPGTDVAAAQARMTKLAGNDLFTFPATLPASVIDLGTMGTLPLALGWFFALLGCAAVGHALVTCVRRRRTDFAVLRSVGFTKRQSRLSIAWQATLLAAVGVVIGVPLGVIVGRSVWRWLAHEFPVLYVPPMALVAIVLIVPLALLIANLIAAGPAHQATRVRPAETLRAD
jgi:hypothetical protein